jgi:cell division protein FtsB
MSVKDGLTRYVSTIQQRLKGEYFFWAFFVVLSASFLWSALVGSQGLLSLMKLNKSLGLIEEENRRLLEEKHLLQKEVYSLTKNPAELEKIIREEYGYVSQNEKVYVLPDSGPPGGRQEP